MMQDGTEKVNAGSRQRELKLDSGPSMSMLGPVMCHVIQLQCELMNKLSLLRKQNATVQWRNGRNA